MVTRRRYFGQVYIDVLDDSDNSKPTSTSVSVYILISVSHTLFDDTSLREACNLHEYNTIEKKSTILSVNLNKTPYLVRFRITLRSTQDSQKIKKMSLYAVKHSLIESSGEILNRIIRVKVWKLDDENNEFIHIMWPKERVKRVLVRSEEKMKGPPKNSSPQKRT